MISRKKRTILSSRVRPQHWTSWGTTATWAFIEAGDFTDTLPIVERLLDDESALIRAPSVDAARYYLSR
jgi:hypothetical protein